jgi:hypothetical protein
MAAFQPNKKAFAVEARILNDRIYLDERAVLIDFLTRLRAAQTPSDYFHLQLELFRRVKAPGSDRPTEGCTQRAAEAPECARSSRAPRHGCLVAGPRRSPEREARDRGRPCAAGRPVRGCRWNRLARAQLQPSGDRNPRHRGTRQPPQRQGGPSRGGARARGVLGARHLRHPQRPHDLPAARRRHCDHPGWQRDRRGQGVARRRRQAPDDPPPRGHRPHQPRPADRLRRRHGSHRPDRTALPVTPAARRAHAPRRAQARLRGKAPKRVSVRGRLARRSTATSRRASMRSQSGDGRMARR